MDTSGEAADLVVKESIQLTEASIKLLAAGSKNLAAFLYALAKDNKKLVGKTSMNRLLREGKELKSFASRKKILRSSASMPGLMSSLRPSRTPRRMTGWWRLSPIRTSCRRSTCSCSAGVIPPRQRSRRSLRQKKTHPALNKGTPHQSAGMARQHRGRARR